MRQLFAVLLLLCAVFAYGQSAVTPESRLGLGIAAYRAADYASAVVDLQAAAQGFLSPEQMQAYVNSGKFDQLPSFETALVYLALSQFRLGREDDARETLLRLHSAERITPTYATLNLGADASEVESLAAALVPSSPLPRNVHLAQDDATGALPAITPKPPVSVAAKTDAERRADREQLIEEIVARERERIQREADARIAADRTTIEQEAARRIAETERQANSRVTAATSEAQQEMARLREDAAKRVALAEAEARQRVTAAEAESADQVAAARRAAEERVATAEATAEKNADARIAEIQRQTEQRIADERIAIDGRTRQEYLMALRSAETAASGGNIDEAVRIYTGLVYAVGVPREVLAEAAVGLYRTGAYRESVEGFRKFGTFAKGEEDLRYYHAVALYETGEYTAARKELACALPFIQLTDDVSRYRLKIESTVSQTARK